MALQLNAQVMKEAISSKDGFIKNGNIECVEGLKYDLRFSGTFLKAQQGHFVNIDDFPASDFESRRIEPGETVFVTTLEELHLPENIKGELSLKRKLAHEGILILGGFCIDPLYQGPLIFGLYNFTSSPFVLEKHKKLVAAQFYKLETSELSEFSMPVSANDLLEDVSKLIHRFSGVSNKALQVRVESLTNAVESLRSEVKDKDEWFDKLKNSIGDLKDLVGSIERSLDREIFERQTATSRNLEHLNAHSDQMERLDKIVSSQAAITKVAYGIIAIVIVPTILVLLAAAWKYVFGTN